MKTLQECKNQVAQRMGFSNWKRFEQYVKPTSDIVDEVATLYAEEKVKEKWMSADPITEETSKRLDDTDSNLIICLFNNGEVRRFDEDHPFAALTHFHFLPQPPTK